MIRNSEFGLRSSITFKSQPWYFFGNLSISSSIKSPAFMDSMAAILSESKDLNEPSSTTPGLENILQLSTKRSLLILDPTECKAWAISVLPTPVSPCIKIWLFD